MKAPWLALVAAAALVPPVAGQGTPDLGTDAQRQTGRQVYAKYCLQCHGEAGDGEGIAAPFLLPRPRDFTAGKYKIRTTPTGALPTDDDLVRVIRQGLPYTAMPGFTELTDEQVQGLVAYLKTFSEDFQDAAAYADPIPFPDPPPYSEESAAAGRAVYEELGCASCHGVEGRGDGTSAPTLKDDWGHPIRPADLSKPWTFRGGAERRDVFRAMSTGLNGTPMPGFADALTVDQRWKIVDLIMSLSGNQSEAPYTNLVRAVYAPGGIDLDQGEEPFAAAPAAMFPVVGQIMQPGRDFHPAATAVTVRAIYDQQDVAVEVAWNDMRADTSGTNAPDLEVPPFPEDQPAAAPAAEEEEGGGGFWGAAEEPEDSGGDAGSFWGEAEDAPAEDSGGGGDFWGEETTEAAPGAATPGSEFSDAVAVQVPVEQVEGIAKPYFLMGDAESPVELWFADLAGPKGALWVAHGSDALEEQKGSGLQARADYDAGRWRVVFSRPRTPVFQEGSFTPLAVSVWDGLSRERGNKRGLTQWQSLYLEPRERPSPVEPMLKAAGLALAVELLIIGLVRYRVRRKET